MKNVKRFLTVFCIVAVLVVSCISCFAASGEQAAFVEELREGLTPDNLWGAVAPYAQLLIGFFIFAFAYRILKKSSRASSNGKFNMG